MPVAIHSLKLRDALIADLPAIVEIYNATIPGRMVTSDLEPVTVADRRPWFEAHQPHSRPLWVVETGAAIAGWLSLNSFYGRPAYRPTVEVSIYVAEGYRRQGVGRYLLAEAIRRSPELGVKTMLGFIFTHNQPSLRLFESFGFERWGQYPNVAVLDGVERSLSVLGKRVVP